MNKGVTMKTAKELVDQINAAKICSPRRIGKAIDMTGVSEVTTIDEEDHRWYVLGTIVFKVGHEFFGVRGPVLLKSEEMSWSDLDETCEAFEMEQVPSVTYRAKHPRRNRQAPGAKPFRHTANREERAMTKVVYICTLDSAYMPECCPHWQLDGTCKFRGNCPFCKTKGD